MKRLKYLVPLMIVAVVSLVIYNAGAKSGPVFDVVAVKLEKLEDTYEEDGVVKTGESKTILSEISGEITEIHFKVNDAVKKGDLLLKINTVELEKQLEILEANKSGILARIEESDIASVMNQDPGEYIASLRLGVGAAKANFETAQNDYQAKENLFSEGAVSRVELDAARANMENARSSYESNRIRYEESLQQFNALKQSGKSEQEINDIFRKSAKEQLEASVRSVDRQMEQVREQIKNGEVFAQEDAVITSYPARNTNVISAGGVIATVKTSKERKQVEAEVLTDAVPYLRPGDRVEFEFHFRGKKIRLPGEIHEIYDFATERISSLGLSEYRVKVVADMLTSASGSEDTKNYDYDQADLIRDGFNTDVKFKLFDAQGMAIPVGAVYETEGKSYCFTVENGRIVKKEISIDYESSTFAVVGSGLKEGDLVIRNANHEELTEGIKVKTRILQ